MVMLYGSLDQTLTPSQLVDATHEKSANITRICDDLLRQDLISREVDPDDRRKVQVRLTTAGEEMITRILPDIVTVTQSNFALLDTAERLQLDYLLRKVIEGQEQMQWHQQQAGSRQVAAAAAAAAATPAVQASRQQRFIQQVAVTRSCRMPAGSM